MQITDTINAFLFLALIWLVMCSVQWHCSPKFCNYDVTILSAGVDMAGSNQLLLLLSAVLSFYSVAIAQLNATEGVSRRLLGIKSRALDSDKLIQTLSREAPYIPLVFQKWSAPHIPSSEAIFACAYSTSYMAKDATFFAGTARKTGFTGDIVVAVMQGANQNFLDKLKFYNVSVYVTPLECSGRSDVRCKFQGVPDYPVTLARYYAYQALALKYSPSAYIMISDFRDVVFQSNPFKNRIADWGPSNYDLVLFNEAHPNRVINRCPQTGGFMVGCYGRELYKKLGANTVSSSGVIFGTRDAIVVYSHLITSQGDIAIRVQEVKTNVPGATGDIAASLGGNKKCWGLGVDQTFHNYLLYTGTFHQLMRVKVFPQGEGPVNTVGGFFGDSKILRASLAEWKILRGEEAYKYVYNWNGEISSVVHQLDRYLTTEMSGGYVKHLAILQHLQ